MSQFTAGWKNMVQISEQIKSCSKEIEDCNRSIQEIQRKMPFDNNTKEYLKNSTQKQAVRLEDISNKCSKMSDVLNASALQYKNTEEELINKNVSNEEIKKDTENNTEDSKNNLVNKVVKTLLKLFGTMGIAGTSLEIGTIMGKIIEAFISNDFLSDADFWKNVNSLIKKSIKVGTKVDGISKAVKEGKEKIEDITKDTVKKFVGANNTAEAKWFEGMKDASKLAKSEVTFNQVIEDEIGELTGAKGAGKCIASWIGNILSLGTNMAENYREQGNKITARGIEETISETGVDIVKDVLIKAGVTAGLVAIMGGAPVIAVGLGTVAVNWALDSGTKWLTKTFMHEEKDFTEFVSDIIVDNFERKVNTIKQAGQTMAKWFKGVQMAFT